MDIKFLLRKSTGDQPIAAEAELREWLQKGQCKPADFLFEFSAGKWGRVGDHPSLASVFSEKPGPAPDRRVIYFLSPGGSAASPQGPFSAKEIQQRAQLREICASTWVFVEGDKEWRQVRNVKILNDMLPALPTDIPANPEAVAPVLDAPPPFSLSAAGNPAMPAAPSFAASLESEPAASVPLPPPEMELPSMPSIKLDLGMGGPPAGASAADSSLSESLPAPSASSSDEPHIEREEVTMALDTMGLNLHSEQITPPPAPPKMTKPGIAPMPGMPAAGPPSLPPTAAPKAVPVSIPVPSIDMPPPKPAKAKEIDTFDGIVAEIPMEPIWLVKQANSESVSGPFRFLEVIKFLEEGKLTKNDKIARSGNKAFTKILQQYEFNVKFSLENVMENGQEKQKILIRRRHPRVPYMTGVQVLSKQGLLAGQCVNISAGGILMEAPKAEFNLGEIIEVKILPGLIAKSISCKSLIIGKIPKIPPGYALKFEDLKPEDKEAIEYYVQETLKREMLKKN